MKFILISDVHVDIMPWNWELLDSCSADCNTIVVSGDISNDIWITSNWLADLRLRFNNLIWVPGNHDFYNVGVHKTKLANSELYEKYPYPMYVNEIYSHYKKWSQDHDIHMIHRDSVNIDNVLFTGATGWHNFVAGEPFSKDQQIDAWQFKSADRIINWRGKTRDNEVVEAAAYEDANYIRNSVSATDLPCVVVTHHLPNRLLSYAKPFDQIWTKLHGMFVNTHCEDIINNNIKYWCYGHTHYRSMKTINGINYVCNPVGYPGENSKWSMVELEV